MLWAERLDDALPADHPVQLFDELLRSAAFAPTFAAMTHAYVLHEGQPPYHPRDLAGLCIYGMLNRIRSSRQLEAACWNRLDVLWLLQGHKPDHATIAAFVTRHGVALRRLLRDTAAVEIRAGLVKLEHAATDGTKIEADAGQDAVRSAAKISAWLRHLDEQIAALEADWEKNEQREPRLLGDAAPWAPRGGRSAAQQVAALKRQRARLQQAVVQIERRQAEAAASGGTCKAIGSTTDPDSRCMKDKEGRSKPNFNAQLAVDTAPAAMIVAAAVNDAAEDTGQLTPTLAQVEANCGQRPAAASADSGYNTGPELAALEAQGIVGYLPDACASSDVPPRSDAEQAAAEARTAAVQAVQAGQTLTTEQWAALPKDAAGRMTRSAFAYDAGRRAVRQLSARRGLLRGSGQGSTAGARSVRRAPRKAAGADEHGGRGGDVQTAPGDGRAAFRLDQEGPGRAAVPAPGSGESAHRVGVGGRGGERVDSVESLRGGAAGILGREWGWAGSRPRRLARRGGGLNGVCSG